MKEYGKNFLLLITAMLLVDGAAHGQSKKISLVNFSMSTCDSDTDPEKLKTAIVGKELRGDTLTIEIATADTFIETKISSIFQFS